jgi:hypothetical protein
MTQDLRLISRPPQALSRSTRRLSLRQRVLPLVRPQPDPYNSSDKLYTSNDVIFRSHRGVKCGVARIAVSIEGDSKKQPRDGEFQSAELEHPMIDIGRKS